MGLLSKIFKKSNTPQFTVQFTEYDAEGNEISIDNTPLSPQEKAEFEEELKFIQWLNSHSDVKMKDDEIATYINVYCSLSNNNAPIDMQLDNLKKLVAFFDEYREYCYAQDDINYKKHFSKQYEHCHNSRCDDFSLVDSYRDRLQEMIDNYDDTKKHQELQKTIEMDLLYFLKENNNILQKDIYKSFDATLKSDIQNLLYQWSKNGTINREKKGNTYIISIKKHPA